jgi:uncharacterized protein with PCYCGC motif
MNVQQVARYSLVLLLAATSNTFALPARPRLDLPTYQLPQPSSVIRSVYDFAADHPEVLQYVPCFCGCEQSGHRSAEQCFVKSRAKNGDVLSWNDHGMTCGMCLAVAKRAMDMYGSHASVKAIRDDVERTYSGMTTNRTPTPTPK